MLTAGELYSALENAPQDAPVYLPGGGLARRVIIAPQGHVALQGDEEEWGTPYERANVAALTATLIERYELDAEKAAVLAREMVVIGAQAIKPPIASKGAVVLTPKVGKMQLFV